MIYGWGEARWMHFTYCKIHFALNLTDRKCPRAGHAGVIRELLEERESSGLFGRSK